MPSSFVAAHYLRNTLNITGKVLLFGMPGFEEEIVSQGIEVFGTGVRHIERVKLQVTNFHVCNSLILIKEHYKIGWICH